jgi:hypothetical protein
VANGSDGCKRTILLSRLVLEENPFPELSGSWVLSQVSEDLTNEEIRRM